MALFAPVVPLIGCVAWHTIEKLGFTIVAVGMAYIIDTMMLDFMHLHLTKLFAGFVCGVEFWSYLENATVASGEESFAQFAQKLKKIASKHNK